MRRTGSTTRVMGLPTWIVHDSELPVQGRWPPLQREPSRHR